MVRIAAVVRDGKGRFVRDLTARDFEVVDGGQTRPITDLQPDIAGVSIAILFDVSGSMEGHLPNAREAATHVLSWLDASRDEAAVYTFDTHLDERAPFTVGLRTLPDSMTQSGAVRRDVAARRDCADGAPRRRARGTPARGRRHDRRRRQRQPSETRGRLGDRQRHRRARLHLRHRPVDRQPVGGDVDTLGREHRVRRSARRPRRLDRRSRRSWQARRDSAASRRGRSSTSCGISTSSHSNRAASRAGIRSWSARATRT